MTRPSTMTIVTVLALTLAGCASLLGYNFLKKHPGKTDPGVAVVSAAVDLPIGSKLEASQVKIASWPKNALPARYFSDAKALIGRVVVRPLSAGDLITEAKLMPLNLSGGLMTYIVPQGHRAVTVAVNEVAGVAGFVTPGSRVDVVLTTPRPGGIKDDLNNISKIILQNVPVLAAGQVTEKKGDKPATTPTVTLDLVPEDAEKILVGLKKGTLQLLLRNMTDIAAIDTKGATVSQALGAVETQRPTVVSHRGSAHRKAATTITAAPAHPKFSMEVIKGGSKSVREFAQD